MGSYGDSTSDLDEELPVFDFLQPKRRLCQDPDSPAEKAGTAATSSSSRGTVQVTSTAEVMMISSDSDDDDDAPYVPLAQRLKQRLNCGSSVSNGKHAEDGSTSSLAGAQPGQVNVPLSISQVQSVNSTLSARSAEEAAHPLSWLPKLKPNPGTGVANVCPAKGKAAKRTAEEIEVCREEALKRREARERQQKDKEALRQEQERQKAERRALSEAAKALRPEECIKHMVAAVDPGKEERRCLHGIQVGQRHFFWRAAGDRFRFVALRRSVESLMWSLRTHVFPLHGDMTQMYCTTLTCIPQKQKRQQDKNRLSSSQQVPKVDKQSVNQ